MYKRNIICLANSRKYPSGRCIAGRVFDGATASAWIRPVSERQTHEVSEEERRYENGEKAQLLDIISVPLKGASPVAHQIENHVLDAGYYWTKKGVATWKQILAVEDIYDANFWRGIPNTRFGANDKASPDEANAIGSSLRLVVVPKVTLMVQTEPGWDGGHARRRVRGQFSVRGESFLLSVTDPVVEDAYLRKKDGTYEIGQAALCVSLAEVWHGYAYRVVASLITPERCGAAK